MIRAMTAIAILALAGCDSRDGLSTAEVRYAAEERVRQSLDLAPESAMFTQVFVGEPVNGETALCGIVQGTRTDGTEIMPRRFIAGTEPARWVKFEPASGIDLPSQPDKFVEWHTHCLGEQENQAVPATPQT